MTYLEILAKFTLDNGGVWYQIFDMQGNRAFASTNYRETYEEYKRLSELA